MTDFKFTTLLQILAFICAMVLLCMDFVYGGKEDCVPATDILLPYTLLFALLQKNGAAVKVRRLAVGCAAVVISVSVVVSVMRVLLRDSGESLHILNRTLPLFAGLLLVSYMLVFGSSSPLAGGSSRRGVCVMFLLLSDMYRTAFPENISTPLSFILALSAFGMFVRAVVIICTDIKRVGQAGEEVAGVHECRNTRSVASGSGMPRTAQTAQTGLYDRIADFFAKEKPFLEDDITIADVARRLYTNKSYISRAINDTTGHNFCQFVNYHRIMYALDLFRENPGMRVGELAEASGFHSIVSFNMAFRLVMNLPPGEWCRKERNRLGVLGAESDK